MAASDQKLDLDEALEIHEHQDGKQPRVFSVAGTVPVEVLSLLLFEDMARYVNEEVAREARSFGVPGESGFEMLRAGGVRSERIPKAATSRR